MSTAPIKIELPPPLLYDSISTTIFGFGGTMGYLDPGFFRNVTLVTEKSDVYSFGVVLFEVLSGRKVFNHDEWFYQKFLIPWILECIKDGTIDHTIDPYLRGKISPRCLDKFMEIAFRCIHNEGNKRPSMGEVEATLELALELQIQADSEIKCIDPNGEYMYEQVLFSSSAFDISDSFAQIHSWKNLYGPHEIYNVESFKSEHSFETDEVISSDIEDLQHGR
ncbi:hypothetical protein COLO4_03896 [Corchorus olitorius]|uniref:Protein kinase domain-containing protein n=1 Tax=Corchorus olitorius TaxID=93759 RepID=A0A1R3KW53_9ROSI|nr:hypothetical protein COLO4_03896 [Corchorus olitorius]